MAPRDTRRLPRDVRRTVLQALSRDRLLDITDAFDLPVEDRRVYDQHVNAIMRSRSIDFVGILQNLSRDELKDICAALGLDDSGREKAPLIERIMSLSEPEEADELESKPPLSEMKEPGPEPSTLPSEEAAPKAAPSGGAHIAEKDPKKVFIIHGREPAILQQLKLFLRAVGLQAWTFDDEIHEAPHSAPIAEIVSRGVSRTRAVIALLTPDEFACLAPDLRTATDSERDMRRWQPRPNVIYEAGMAMALNRDGTILVTVGRVDLPSDLDGVLHIRMSNHYEDRKKLRKKLLTIGCAVDADMDRDDWTGPAQGGNFEVIPLRTMPMDPYASK
jgi:predicted nucleotide-binding protein